MLWFDNSQRSLLEKIQRAADYYQKKYGRAPDLCMVNPQALSSGVGSPGTESKLTVRPSRIVLPGHLWLGIEDHQEETTDA
jgi:hypothetical protein